MKGWTEKSTHCTIGVWEVLGRAVRLMVIEIWLGKRINREGTFG